MAAFSLMKVLSWLNRSGTSSHILPPELSHLILLRHKGVWKIWAFFMPRNKIKHIHHCLMLSSHLEAFYALCPKLLEKIHGNVFYIFSISLCFLMFLAYFVLLLLHIFSVSLTYLTFLLLMSEREL